MMTISADGLCVLVLVWAALAVLVTVLTARAARRRVDSAGLLTLCNALLGLFPPFNLLVLAALIMLPERRPG